MGVMRTCRPRTVPDGRRKSTRSRCTTRIPERPIRFDTEASYAGEVGPRGAPFSQTWGDDGQTLRAPRRGTFFTATKTCAPSNRLPAEISARREIPPRPSQGR